MISIKVNKVAPTFYNTGYHLSVRTGAATKCFFDLSTKMAALITVSLYTVTCARELRGGMQSRAVLSSHVFMKHHYCLSKIIKFWL